MKRISNKIGQLIRITLVLLIPAFYACNKDMDGKLYQVSDQKMVDEILENNDSLSSFLKIIDLSGMRGTVHAYGTYTLFAPTNRAIETFLTASGKTLASLSETEASGIIKYHLIPDTIPTSMFVDGRLSSMNFSNKYLTTKIVAKDGGVFIEVNRQAQIVINDQKAANGYVHVVNNVLSQSPKSIQDVMNSLPDTYSIWKEAWMVSGMKDSLNTLTSSYTCMIQSNDAYANSGITGMGDLLTELRSKNPTITDDQKLLYNYIAYHLTPGYKYLVDLYNLSSLKTMIDGEVIVLKRNVDQIVLNEFEIGGVLEKGVNVDKTSTYTDLSCSNGVIQDIKGNIQIVKRNAFRVYWDIAEQAEIMALKGFRKAGTSVTFDNTEIAGITWGKTATTNKITYNAMGYPTTITKDNNFVYGDGLKFRLSTNTIKWIEFKTPVLVPGTYKVWLSYRALASTSAQTIRTIFKDDPLEDTSQDQILGSVLTSYNKSATSYGLTSYGTELFQKALLDGYRHQMINSKNFWDTSNCCQAMGIIQVNTTGQHVIRFEPLTTRDFTTTWDQIMFIPIDDDQIWPKQDIAGKLIYADTPNCQIYPYSDCPLETTSQP